FAVAPDGRALVFQAVDNSGAVRLWLRRLDELNANPIPGTEGGAAVFWSPDSRSIAFEAGGKLKGLDLAGGGVPTSLADASGNIRCAWGRDDVILFTRDRSSGLSRVSAAGGPSAPATKVDTDALETAQHAPAFLAD